MNETISNFYDRLEEIGRKIDALEKKGVTAQILLDGLEALNELVELFSMQESEIDSKIHELEDKIEDFDRLVQ